MYTYSFHLRDADNQRVNTVTKDFDYHYEANNYAHQLQAMLAAIGLGVVLVNWSYLRRGRG